LVEFKEPVAAPVRSSDVFGDSRERAEKLAFKFKALRRDSDANLAAFVLTRDKRAR
jgi:hypothetical protein